MMIGKPNDVGSPQSASRTADATSRRMESGGVDGKVAGVQATDSVKLSETGRAIVSTGEAVAEFRADKVAALRKSIAEGTYHVQAKVVAERMIMEAAELLESMTAQGA
jgi:flagellar biosynthesis anti-sigma factor FlgM